jgi:RNA polymerase sigma-70 factor (ECF subfamily)
MEAVSKTSATELVDHLFRRMAGQLQSTLVRVFGPENIGLAEDVVQETLIKAFETWQYGGPPPNPEAWLTRVARNKAIDYLRHERSLKSRAIDLSLASPEQASVEELALFEDPFGDDQLSMIFLSCHPALSQEGQLALTLKIVAGLGVSEIAKAFLVPDETIAQRIVRAKRKIRDDGLGFEMPESYELYARLENVLSVIYLLFNEGYTASTGNSLIHQELCAEAIRLGELLAERLGDREPKIHALMALMLLQASRLSSRLDSGGSPLLLASQDRSTWDQTSIAAGIAHLKLAMRSHELSKYHLLAGIAVCHATAATYEETDWKAIRGYYDALILLDPSPIAELNRAIAISMTDGPQAGLAALEPLQSNDQMKHYHYLPATLGELYERSGDHRRARHYYFEAIGLTTNEIERRFLEEKYASAGRASVGIPTSGR